MTRQNTPDNVFDRLTGRTITVRHRRRIPIWVIIVVFVGVIAAGAIGYFLLAPLDAPIPDGVDTHYAGLERGYTDQGFPRLGSADAPTLVEDFSSFACPHCRDFHDGPFNGLLDEIAAGQVQFVFIPLPHIGMGANSAAKGALCAGEQGQFWEMHDVLFSWQEKFIFSTFNERRINKGARNLGLDADAFETCMNDDQVEQVLDWARAEFDRRGLRGTPSFFIDGQRVQDYREFETIGASLD
ncbi:MAG: thioredoxin domain-containing protein [Anaerolineae bacterium]|nr:thioredoxin domain-containing protein [Anaerolineae bacterium]